MIDIEPSEKLLTLESIRPPVEELYIALTSLVAEVKENRLRLAEEDKFRDGIEARLDRLDERVKAREEEVGLYERQEKRIAELESALVDAREWIGIEEYANALVTIEKGLHPEVDHETNAR